MHECLMHVCWLHVCFYFVLSVWVQVKGIQIFVQMPTGKTLTIDCELWDRVATVKAIIYGKEGVSRSMQRLLHRGVQLNDIDRLLDYGIENNASLQLVMRLRGTNDHV